MGYQSPKENAWLNGALLLSYKTIVLPVPDAAYNIMATQA